MRAGKLSTVTKNDARYNSIIEDHKGRISGGEGAASVTAKVRSARSRTPRCNVTVKRKGWGAGMANVLAADKGGAIWVGDERRVCSWKDGTAETYSAPATNTACKPAIGSLLADFDDSMLISCAGSLRRLDQGSFVRFQGASLDADKLKRIATALRPRGQPMDSVPQNDGVVPVTNGIADHFGAADGLSDDSVSALYEDHEGNVRVATANGIDRFHRLSVISFSSKQGLGGPGDRAVLSSRDGHTIWTDWSDGLRAMRDGVDDHAEGGFARSASHCSS